MDSKKIVCFGEILLRHTSIHGELLFQSPNLETYVGGAEANVAVSLSNLGQSTKVVSAVPDNSLGNYAIQELQKYDVDVSNVIRDKGRMGQYFLTQGNDYRRSEVTYDREYSVFSQLHDDAYHWDEIFNDATWFHLSGITPAVSEKATAHAMKALEVAHQKGLTISFDGNFRETLWQERRAEVSQILNKILSLTDIAFLNEKDVSLILEDNFDHSEPLINRLEAIKSLLSVFPNIKTVYSTFRHQEANSNTHYSGISINRDTELQTVAYSLSSIIDRIGTGDAFAAGIIHSLMIGKDEQYVIDFGTASAVLKHSIRGDFNLATTQQVENVMNNQSLDVKR